MKDRPESKPLWPGMRAARAARMTHRDLESADLPYKTEEGIFDFHALRQQFITNLARCGVYPKVAQVLARHSTIVLTMDRYSHTDTEQLQEPLASDVTSSGGGTRTSEWQETAPNKKPVPEYTRIILWDGFSTPCLVVCHRQELGRDKPLVSLNRTQQARTGSVFAPRLSRSVLRAEFSARSG